MSMKRRSLSESNPKTVSARRSCMTALPKRKLTTIFGWQTSASSNCIPARSNVSVVSKNTPNFSTSVRKSLFLKSLNESLQKSGRKSQGNVSMEVLDEMSELYKDNLKKTPPRGLKRLRRDSGSSSSSGSVGKCLKKLKPNENVFEYIFLYIAVLIVDYYSVWFVVHLFMVKALLTPNPVH